MNKNILAKVKDHYYSRKQQVYRKAPHIITMWDDKEKIRKQIYQELISNESIIVEVGVRLAENACLMYMQNPKEMYLVDPWISNDGYPHHSKNNIFYEQVKKVFDNCDNVSIIRSMSEHAVSNFKDNFIDIAYIDSGHTYKDALRDLRLFAPKIKTGGYIIGDDYFDDPKVDELSKKYKIKWAKHQYGVIPAVNKFLEENTDFDIYYSKNLNKFPLPAGQFVLQKMT